MPAPVLVKAWEIVPNQVVPSQAAATHSQESLFLIKNTLVNFVNNPWVVAGSCDSVSFNIGGADLWVDQSDIIANTGAHSWIILQRVDGAQLLIDCDTATLGNRIILGWSASAGFTGGTTTVRPTATDEIGCDEVTVSAPGLLYWNGNQGGGTPVQNVYHFWHSTDGLITRIVPCAAGKTIGIWRFETIFNPRAAHTNNPTLAGVDFTSASTTERPTVTLIEDSGVGNTEKNGTGLGVRLLGAGMGNGNLNLVEKASAAVAEEWDNELWCTEEHLFCETVGHRGPKGKTVDIFFGQYQIYTTGDTFPNTPSARAFVAMGPYVHPWTGDATIPQVA